MQPLFIKKMRRLTLRRTVALTLRLGLLAFAAPYACADEKIAGTADIFAMQVHSAFSPHASHRRISPRPLNQITPRQLAAQQPISAMRAADVVIEALHMIGVKYQWGGNTPASGMDCSGFVKYVFQNAADVTLPRRAVQMSRVGHTVPIHQLKPGDLVFFNTHNSLRKTRVVSHVGIYIGNNQFVHSPRTGKTIRIDKLGNRYWKQRYTGAKRITRLFASA